MVIVVVVVLLGATVALLLTDAVYQRVVDTVATETIGTAERGFDAIRVSREANMRAALAVLLQDAEVREAFDARDREALQAVSWSRFEVLRDEIGMTRMFFYEPDAEGTIFLRTFLGEGALDPASFGQPSQSESLRHARETRTAVSGFELGSTALSVRVVGPMLDEAGGVVGYIGLGERVEDYLGVISQQTENDFALFLDKDHLDRDGWARVRAEQGLEDNWDDWDGLVVADSTVPESLLPAEIGSIALPEEGESRGMVRLGRGTYATGTFPIRDFDGDVVGFVYAMHDVTRLAGSFRTAQIGLVLAFLGVAVTGALVTTYMLERVVFRRIDSMAAEIEGMSLAVAAGEYGSLTAGREYADDEIGRLERFFGAFLLLVATALRVDREQRDRDSAGP